jgi:hypothetical protein
MAPPISTLQGTDKLTPQQLADFALIEDQERRRAEKRGDLTRAQEAAEEVGRLCDLSRK